MTHKPPALEDLLVSTLGPPRFNSTFGLSDSGYIGDFRRELLISEAEKIGEYQKAGEPLPSFERAGAREKLFFDPSDTIAGIVTCGGLCPGLNDVIRSVTLTLKENYKVKKVLGFRYGYKGLSARGPKPMNLDQKAVDGIQESAGTLLGSSRGPQDIAEMVETLWREHVNILFAIGGDGTLRGASDIAAEIKRRELPISVIGIPKTIDNDINWMSTSFGFRTAVEEAKKVILAAHAEARGAENGIGIVKLMGRHSGFIAVHATMASSVVNYCLVPEVPFELEGDRGLLRLLEKRFERKDHAVIVVSEGAGQHLCGDQESLGKDASGNARFGDIGVLLKKRIGDYLTEKGLTHTIKYIDPSYIIRSTPANTVDSEFCMLLGLNAAHAGMAGKTDMTVGLWHNKFVHIPISIVTGERKMLDPNGERWRTILSMTLQPEAMR